MNTFFFAGLISFQVVYASKIKDDQTVVSCKVVLSSKTEKEISTIEQCSGQFKVDSPKLWWPYLMNPSPGYLYDLKVSLFNRLRFCKKGLHLIAESR